MIVIERYGKTIVITGWRAWVSASHAKATEATLATDLGV
jgi:hypothetical protein